MCVEVINGMADTIVELEQRLAERQWIPCSKRMPNVYAHQEADESWEQSEEVLICDKKGNMFVARYEDDGDGRTYWNGQDGIMYKSIIAWMPLPKPYKAESEDEE